MIVAIRHDVDGETVTSTGLYEGSCEVGDSVTIQCPDENSGSDEKTGTVIEIISE